MPNHMLSILKDLYNADKYTLLDGKKSSYCSAICWCGTKVPLPLPLRLLSSIFLNDIDSMTDRVRSLVSPGLL